MNLSLELRELIMLIPMMVLSLALHEYAHAYAATKLGDLTAKNMGRLSMNPLPHTDLIGTIILPAVMVMSRSSFFFGWAKPVPVDTRNLQNPRRDMAIIAAAGPLMNIALAVLFAWLLSLVFNSVISFPGNNNKVAVQFFAQAMSLNLFLAFFNLLPLQPLDGSRIVNAFVSEDLAQKLERNAGMAQWVLILLLISGMLKYLSYPVLTMQSWLLEIFGVNLYG